VGSLHQTWGQYQEVAANGIDLSIYHHEGIDINAAKDEEVSAIHKGKITYIRLPKATETAYDSIISIKDDVGDRGWNYKHLAISANLRVGDKVNAGSGIGKVADPPAGIARHLHIDRGNKTQATDLRLLFAPNLNPLSEFYDNQGILNGMDTTKPTVSTIQFRINRDDALAIGAAPSANSRGGDESVRKTAHYFEKMVANTQFLHVGYNAKSEALPTTPATRPIEKNVNNSTIDIIADAYDSFGRADRLGVTRLAFIINGLPGKDTANLTSGPIKAIDFREMKDITALTQFLSLKRTRTIYENSD